MPRFVYTSDMLAFIKSAYYQTSNLEKIAESFNRIFGADKTTAHLRAAIKNHKLYHLQGHSRPQPQRRLLTPEQEAWLCDAYKKTSLVDLPEAIEQEFGINLTVSQVKAYTKNHGITSGRTGQFKKGSQPWNTGKTGYMTANTTSFKPGQDPPNRRQVGSERICSKDGYVIIKTDAINPYTGFVGYWRHKHVVIWEKHHGPVPEGMIVVFKNSDKTNIRIDNLELITRGEHAVRNKLHYSSHHDEIKPSVALLAKIHQKKRHRMKEKRA